MLGIKQGATENAVVVKALLEDLVERGLLPERLRLFVVDGSKALRSAITAGGHAPPGSIMPSASVHSAIVDAVPITMQVPAEGASLALMSLISRSSISDARNLPQ